MNSDSQIRNAADEIRHTGSPICIFRAFHVYFDLESDKRADQHLFSLSALFESLTELVSFAQDYGKR